MTVDRLFVYCYGDLDCVFVELVSAAGIQARFVYVSVLLARLSEEERKDLYCTLVC